MEGYIISLKAQEKMIDAIMALQDAVNFIPYHKAEKNELFIILESLRTFYDNHTNQEVD